MCGGERIGTEGYYVKPTVFADVTNSMTIAREEIFGPVGVFIRFKTVEEAVAIANDSDFGLAAGVWTSSLDTTVYCTEKLEVCWRLLCGICVVRIVRGMIEKVARGLRRYM